MANRDFFGAIWLFWLLPLINILTYFLLIGEFLVDNIYGNSISNTYKLKILLEGLECYKDTKMKAYDITNLSLNWKAKMYSEK